MASRNQVAWPCSWVCFHASLPHSVVVPRGPYSGCVCGMPSVIPPYCNTVTTKFGASKFTQESNRRFALDRSVFDLVDSHLYLSLTDPKLLGWYLCLSQEDRKLIQDEGGFHQFLLRHPALELSRHHVYVKHNIRSTSPAEPAMTSQKKSGGKKTCSCEEELNKLPSPVREAMSLLGCCSDMDETSSRQHPHEQLVQGPSLFELDEEGASWKMTRSSSSTLSKDPAAPSCFSKDMEPEELQQEGKPELCSWTETTQGQSANLSCPEVSTLQSDWSAIEQDSSKDYSFDSRLGTQEELQSKAGGLDHLVYGKEATLSCGDSNSLSSVMKDDQSILAAFVPKEERRETFTSSPKEERRETFTSAPPPVAKSDAMVGTELAQHTSAFTNTEAPESSDKHTITEVHMADLDYFTEEFIKLKEAIEELRELKEKMKSSGCKWRKECECFQRAQQAELGLLALQYNMCRQHCWRLYCTSAEGDQLTQGPKDPPVNISSVEQQLESDFDQMRAEILAGVPLQQLKPLSVDCGRIMTEGCYVPAQIIAEVLEKVSQTHQTSGHGKGCAGGQSRSSSQGKEKEMKESSKMKAFTLLLQDKNMIPNAQRKLEETQTASCKELSTSEAWYDAEEDLQPEMERDATKDGLSGGSKNQASDYTCPPAAAQADQKPESPNSKPERKLVSQPPLIFSIGNRKVVCTSPAARRTFVPQSYCTMDGFERLMLELKQRHPEVSRERIMDALVSLRAKHNGVLSGLPLSAIRDMTSELLTLQQQHSDVEALI